MSICEKDFIKQVEQVIDYEFKTPKLLIEALTHTSYSREQKVYLPDNQRMEFLGDAVVELVVSEKLFKKFKTVDEGKMSKMRASVINRFPMAAMARSLKLNEFIFIGRGEQIAGGENRDSTLCDVFEALIAAVYLDSGYDSAKTLFWLAFNKCNFDLKSSTKEFNPKGTLQELTQKHFSALPVYTLKNTIGPVHQPVYTVEVTIEEFSAEASGPNRKKAESVAAAKLIELINQSF